MAAQLAEPRRLVDQRHPDFLLNAGMRGVAEAIHQLAVGGDRFRVALHLAETHAALEQRSRHLRLNFLRGVFVEASDDVLAGFERLIMTAEHREAYRFVHQRGGG